MAVPYKNPGIPTGAGNGKPALPAILAPIFDTPASATAIQREAKYVQNPPFDGRIGGRGAVDSNGNFVMLDRSNVQRGAIITAEQNAATRYAFNFQYNPQTIVHNSTLNQDILVDPSDSSEIDKRAKDAKQQGSNWSVFVQNTGQSVSFNLLLDRTMEVWKHTDPDNAKTPVTQEGVLADIKVLYAMLGMYGDIGANQINQMNPTGVLSAVPVWVLFSSSIAYYGTVQQCDVQFTHFAQDMTPIRATIGLNLLVLPKADPVPRGWNNRYTTMNSKQRIAKVEKMLQRGPLGKNI